jgi:hypothetical protein
MGIRLLSTVSTNLQGGYWDLDHVRLSAQGPLTLGSPSHTNDQVQFTIASEPGQIIRIFASDDLQAPASSWIEAGSLTNVAGTVLFTDPVTNLHQRFYRAQLSL